MFNYDSMMWGRRVCCCTHVKTSKGVYILAVLNMDPWLVLDPAHYKPLQNHAIKRLCRQLDKQKSKRSQELKELRHRRAKNIFETMCSCWDAEIFPICSTFCMSRVRKNDNQIQLRLHHVFFL